MFFLRGNDTLAYVSQALRAVLEVSSGPDCSVFFLSRGVSSSDLLQLAHGTAAPWGVGVFEVAEDLDGNATEVRLSRVVGEARDLRMLSWCVNVVVLSDDPAFLASFGESSLRGRLLVWATRLLVITRLPLQELHRLFSSSWTFSMMNTIFINLEEGSGGLRQKIYAHFPYGRDGPQVVEVASWTSARGLSVRSGRQLFPEKFENFHGAEVGVTALPFRPYWIEEETKAPDGALLKTYSGSDGLLLTAIAAALNFSFVVLPVAGWGVVTSLVTERKSMMAAIYHILLPQRKERYDFTFTYEQIKTDFCMAKPSLGSNWQSLYYPLSHGVWASILAMLVVISCVLYVVTRLFNWNDSQRLGAWGVTEVVLGSLLGQSILQRMGKSSRYRVLVATWLIFAFIVGTAYRGNLTAALTLPAYPPRPETIEQLVKAVES
ncbi:glutamate receptor ionotropic, kainate 4-like [Penaeus monodon]|uniref:glutamate receptor ionotropic, kainate 4-like n=1 Tax=Penaeus monodon TaxID=6687 RepID=UPI0018A735F4|nr:glutamate receptor ionotropic, kainate 4-like [Penaeus monodon]